MIIADLSWWFSDHLLVLIGRLVVLALEHLLGDGVLFLIVNKHKVRVRLLPSILLQVLSSHKLLVFLELFVLALSDTIHLLGLFHWLNWRSIITLVVARKRTKAILEVARARSSQTLM